MSPLLVVLLVSSLCFQATTGSLPFIDFQLTTADPNHLALECYSAVTGDVDDGANIGFFSVRNDNAPLQRIVLVGTNGAPFDITPENEAFLRCTSSAGDSQSGFVAIAAVPPDLSMETQTMNVFAGEFTELGCPIPLGNLHTHLDPYIFSWDQFRGSFFVPINSTVNPSLFSNNNRTLRILINEETGMNQYRCKLALRRCDIIGTGGSHRCPVREYDGPRVRFDVYETSRIMSPPMSQEIPFGEVASFVCVGSGSFISISWQYDEVCDAGLESCGNIVVLRENVTGENRSRQIHSTLMIDTTLIQYGSVGGGYSFTITCVILQNVPAELQRGNLTFSERLNVTGLYLDSVEKGIVTAGDQYTLQCGISISHPNTIRLEVMWLDPGNDIITSDNSATISNTTSTNATTLTSTLTFPRLTTSQGGLYSCVLTINIHDFVKDHQVILTAPVSVAIPPSTVITFQHDREGVLYVGTPIKLVCVVVVDRTLVDTDIMVEFRYGNLPSNVNDTTRVTTNSTAVNASTFMGVAKFKFLLPSDEGVTYSCESILQSMENTSYVIPAVMATLR